MTRGRWWQGPLVLVPLLLGLALLVSVLWLAKGPVAFDSHEWKAASATACNDEGADGDRRHRMVNDLQKNHLSIGMTRRQVRSLLGAPESTYKRLNGLTDWTWATQQSFTRCFYFRVTFSGDRLIESREYE